MLHTIETKGTFSNSFYEATVTLINKPHKDTKKENYRPIFLMNIDVKVLNEYKFYTILVKENDKKHMSMLSIEKFVFKDYHSLLG